MEVLEKLHLISDLQKRIEDTKKTVLKSLFRSIPNLKSIKLNSEQEYDDNNYNLVTRIISINGQKIDDLSNLEFGLEHVDPDSSEYRAALVEMDLKDEELECIVKTLQALSPLYLEEYDNLLRKDFVRE